MLLSIQYINLSSISFGEVTMKEFIKALPWIMSVAAFSVSAAPLFDVKVTYKKKDGNYHYTMKITNPGPILPNVTTPPGHTITDWRSPLSPKPVYAADGKYLSDDENLVLFGIDTKSDDVTISAITDSPYYIFHGTEEQGFNDTDGDGSPNKVAAWHLPFYGWTVDNTVKVGRSIKVSFVLSQEIRNFDVWVGGSDDANIWNDGNAMVENEFGIYDATQSKYLASFMTRSNVRAQRNDHDD